MFDRIGWVRDGLGAREDERCECVGLGRGGPDCHVTAERLTEQQRAIEAESVGEVEQVVSPGGQVPLVWRATVGPSHPALIEEDHLRDIGERFEERPQRAVIRPGTTVDHQDRRDLVEALLSQAQLRPNDVEKQPRAVA